MTEPKKTILFKSSQTEIWIEDPESTWQVVVDVKGVITRHNLSSKEEALEKAKSEIYSDKQKHYLKRLLLLENVMVLAGAGSSLIPSEKGTGGLTMKQLWEKAENEISLVDRVASSGLSKDEQDRVNGNLELLLSALSVIKKGAKVEGDTKKAELAQSFINDITSLISTACRFSINEHFPHEVFIRNLLKTRKKGDSRLKVFSLNYDTCFEQVSDNMRGIVIDGFNFSSRPEFRSSSFDCDIVQRQNNRVHSEHNYIDNVFHLYKLHGSVNWEKKDEKIYKNDETENPFLIYPGNEKFETTYETPFFELLSRFQKSLSEKNSLLLIIGYSFGDKHINQVILEAIKSNVNLHVVVLSSRIIDQPSENEAEKERYKLYERINSGFKDLAFIGGRNCFSDFVDRMPRISSESIEEERRKILDESYD